MCPIPSTQLSLAAVGVASAAVRQEEEPESSSAASAGPAAPDDLPRLPPGAGRPDAARAQFVRNLAEHDRQLASYLMGRRVDGREIEGGELERLHGANDVLQESRAALHIGRGNVTTDIAATDGHSARTYAAARVVRNSRKLNELPQHRAAIAEVAGAGNCGEHAAVTVHKLAARLSEGEEVHSVYNRAADHGWAELRGQAADARLPALRRIRRARMRRCRHRRPRSSGRRRAPCWTCFRWPPHRGKGSASPMRRTAMRSAMSASVFSSPGQPLPDVRPASLAPVFPAPSIGDRESPFFSGK